MSRAEQNQQRPIDVSEVTGNVRPVVPSGGSALAGVVYPAGPDGHVVADGPVGPCETPSPSSEEIKEPLEHAVLIHAVQHAAVGTLSHLTVTLLAQLARASQGALLAQLFEQLVHRGDLRLGAGGASGSGRYPGRSTYGGDYLPGTFGCGGVSGQWTHEGDVESGIIGAIGS